MEFSKKYPITQRSKEFIQANWSRGYQEIDLFYNNQLLASFSGGVKLIKGIKQSISGFGEIELKFSENPITLDIIIDGIHSTVNVSHPKKQLGKSSFFFWILFAGAILMSALEVASIGQNTTGMIVAIINFLVIAVYMVAAIFVNKGQVWAFYLGFSCFSVFMLLSLLSINTSLLSVATIIVKIMFLWFLISNIKYATETTKHNRFDTIATSDLLDNY